MKEDNQRAFEIENEGQEEDIKKLVFQYLHYWRWFVLGVVTCVAIAFIYAHYSTTVYKTTAEIKILEPKDNGIDLSGLEGASDLLNMDKVNLENEIEVIKSRKLLDSVVKSLHLNTVYYLDDGIKDVEIWQRQTPFIVRWNEVDSVLSNDEELPIFTVTLTSPTQFTIGIEDEVPPKKASYNVPIKMGAYNFIVIKNPLYTVTSTDDSENHYTFKHIFTADAIDHILKNITVTQVGDDSDVLNIAYKGSNTTKNEAIINTLIQKFNEDGIRDKQLVSKRTELFVTQRLRLLSHELDTVETGLVNYKQSNRLVTLESTTKQLYGKEFESEQKRFQIQVQIEMAKAFKQQLTKSKKYTLLPANLGIESDAVNQLTALYNEQVAVRNDLLTSATLKNPYVKSIETKLDNIKQNIVTSVDGYIHSLTISLQNLKSREDASANQLYKIPQMTKGMRGIVRQREIKEKLYLFLLQKREEAALQYSVTTPSIKVVDYAYTNPIPIAPKSKIIYLGGLILGVLIPFGFLYIKFLFDTKISGRESIEALLPNIPVLAEVPQVEKGENLLIIRNDHSILAEAFRILRTNLAYFNSVHKNKEHAQLIFVTSTIKGEGKTFTAVNTAHSIASTGKKTLIIGCDLRNPQTHRYYEGIQKNDKGVTHYLSDDTLKMSDLIHTGDKYFENLHLITSGAIPPNPAELLMSNRFKELLDEAKEQYDCIIVDTAPTLLVTDTLLISDYADITLYVTRANYTDKKLMEHVEKMVNVGKLKHIGIIINGIGKNTRYGYGYSYNYGYGYGYSEDAKKPWWKKW